MKAPNGMCLQEFDKKSKKLDQDSLLFYAPYYGAKFFIEQIFVEFFIEVVTEFLLKNFPIICWEKFLRSSQPQKQTNKNYSGNEE